MKKKIAALIVIWLVTILFYYSRIHGFIIHKSSYYKTKPDDSISKALSESVDTKWMHYRGKFVNDAGTVTIYRFHINKEKEGLAEAAVEAINEVLVQEKTSNKISINFWTDFLPGASEILFSLQNFYQANDTLADYDSLQCLIIGGTHHGASSIYNDPEGYKNFPDIRYLIVEEQIQQAAKKKGIDWYEYWPELEVMMVSPNDSRAEVISKSLDVKWMQYWGKTTEGGGIAPTAPPYSFTYTVHISREQKGMAEAAATAVNEVLVREHTQNRVCVVFTETIPAGGTEELFCLQNYYREDASLADCEKLRCLIINGTNQGDPDSIYNVPETYQDFPDIRYLKVSEKIQKAAEEKGIDWYEYWPELKEVEVY